MLASWFLLCLFCAFIPAVMPLSHVPVLLWSTERSILEFKPTVHGGHVTSEHEFHRLLDPAINADQKTIILFLQETLGMEDFNYFSSFSGSEDIFYNVKVLLNSSPSSLVLPAVNWKTIHHLPGYLKNQANWNLIRADALSLSSVELEKEKSNLIIVKLLPVPRSSKTAAAKAFSENDKVIGRLTKELTKRDIDFIWIYTGMKPSQVLYSFEMTAKTGRQLKSLDTTVQYPPLNVTNGTDNTCILIYAQKILITANNSLVFDLTNMTFEAKTANTSLSTCSESNTTLSLLYSSPGNGIGSLEIRFVMTNQFYTGSARNWFKLQSVQIISDGDVSRTAIFNTTYASTPAEYSYHCQQIGTSSLYGERLIRSNSQAGSWDIFISEFQIQGFNIKNNLFSYASDCASFFTPAIWMGLVSSIVLLWILSYGIFMIMQLTTNDKFDDPKGQPLSVPQTE
ncbi:ATPase, H+ transporting, lysosomal accessory protein 1, gene 1 L homeolog precursor [Xenopus laevis]|uniref:ATPase, H+ transporting, lysosomal accessory protein 1, gene 1 L homeolog precursor n=1 Tax=Xenopus laevis TaxID=8355 RepID=D2WPH1_XENLA|nr:ATPase, H+ transporting, lysosomal accessory protein 1, gene 1 L homeolog precursor [Xenopus laevis]ADB20256.1 V-ATPase accessory subunit Ac45-like protein [Xenopus laevis]